MSDLDSDAEASRRQQLSALIDGELSGDAVRGLSASWRNEPQVRETWHAYSLIGDVMRSEDLAKPAASDERFLQRLREKLADEPIVLAPEVLPRVAPAVAAVSVPAMRQRAQRRGWRTPAAVAAGFVVVAGTLSVLSRNPQPASDEAARLAAASAPVVVAASPVPTLSVAEAASGASAPEFVATGEVVRDPRIDRYLLAHKPFPGNSLVGASSGFLRNAAADAPDR
jgi:sigma-E factor negative regulatory protein RseA